MEGAGEGQSGDQWREGQCGYCCGLFCITDRHNCDQNYVLYRIKLHFKLPFPDNSAPSQHPIDLPMTQISSMHTVRETERQRETECQRETERRETERDKTERQRQTDRERQTEERDRHRQTDSERGETDRQIHNYILAISSSLSTLSTHLPHPPNKSFLFPAQYLCHTDRKDLHLIKITL